MKDRPYTLVSCAVSADGYLDDASTQRLLLSNDADFDRVDEVRAGCDAILVGANTIRRDDPRLLIRDPARRLARVARAAPPDPIKVTMTRSGDLDPGRRFFAAGDAAKLVYTPAGVARGLAQRLPGAEVIAAESLPAVLADLSQRGVNRLLVEGGAEIILRFLEADAIDELHLVVAPFFVADPAAPRLTGSGSHGADSPMRLASASHIGDCALLRYLLTPAGVDQYWLEETIAESSNCPPSTTAFSVGAILVDAAGREISRGYSREGDPYVHAEESALSKVDIGNPRLTGATLYSSLEPCSARASRPRPCSALIQAAGIARVVYAWREPAIFVDCNGAEELAGAGVEVVELAALAGLVRTVNAHLLVVG